MYASDCFVVHFPVVKFIEFFTQIYSLSRKKCFMVYQNQPVENRHNKKVVKLDLSVADPGFHEVGLRYVTVWGFALLILSHFS